MTVSPDNTLPGAFDGYRPGAAPYDELVDDQGRVRPAWADLVSHYGHWGADRLRAATNRLTNSARDEGVIYNLFDGAHTEARDWQIDPVPLIVDGAEWIELEKSIAQRSMLLDLLLRDFYHDQKTITSGLVPPEFVYGHPGYLRKATRLEVAGPHALFLHAVDLGRDADGRYRVFADRTQAPSGIGYATIGRRLMSRTFPHLFSACAPRPITTFAGTLRLALLDYAPPGVDDPTVVMLSPGSMSETAFDQAYLASMLGVPLVEGADLTVREGTVYMRSLGRYKRVDVLLRRIDAEFADPLDLRTDSRLGVAGLVEAISRGTVTVVNTLGSGVLENPALHTVLERLAPVLLDEELLLPSVQTWWAGDDLQRTKIHADLAGLSLTDFRTGTEVSAALLDSTGRDALAAQIDAQPWRWVARSIESASVAPTLAIRSGAGEDPMRAAAAGIRAFSVASGPGYAVMPGGLGAVLAPATSDAALNTFAAKDVWVTSADVGGHVSRKAGGRTVGAEEVAADESIVYSHMAVAASPRVLNDLFWFGRYGERTELITRLARVSRDRYQDVQYRPWMSGSAAVPMVLHAAAEVTGTSGYLGTDGLLGEDPTDTDVDAGLAKIIDLTVARSVPGTIAHAVERLVGSARAVRDQLSTSTWMVLTPVEAAVSEFAARVAEARHAGEPALDLVSELGRTHDDVVHGTLALAGLQAESMVHDPGWLFMDVGRRIERVITLAELTATMFVEVRDREVEQALLESFLVANESAVIYRRRNRGMYRLGAVADLLFFDESNPRSMIYQLERMRSDLGAVPDELRSAAAERIVEDLIAAVRRSDPVALSAAGSAGRRAELATVTQSLADGARDLSDLLGRTRLAPPQQAQPIWAGQVTAG